MAGCPCYSEKGLISTSIEHVFQLVHQSNDQKNFTIKCAYLESKENLTQKFMRIIMKVFSL